MTAGVSRDLPVIITKRPQDTESQREREPSIHHPNAWVEPAVRSVLALEVARQEEARIITVTPPTELKENSSGGDASTDSPTRCSTSHPGSIPSTVPGNGFPSR